MILVVDDDQQVRSTIVRGLTALGYAVREAAGGADALALIEEQKPQLVVLDYMMPGMDGAETAREIARIDPDLPIVFSTGHAALRALRQAGGGGGLDPREALHLCRARSIDLRDPPRQARALGLRALPTNRTLPRDCQPARSGRSRPRPGRRP